MMRIFVVGVLFLASCTSDQVKRDRFFLQGNNALNNREYDQAIQFYTQALDLDRSFARAFNNRGVAYMEDDHPYEAIQDYNMAIAIDQNYYEAVFNRAYAYEQVGRVDDALEDVFLVKKAFPDSAYVHFYQGLLESRLRDYPASMKSFQRSLELDPGNHEARINLATLYYFQGNTEKATAILKEVLRENPNEANALNTLSQVYLTTGDHQNSLITINQALKLIPDEPYFLNNRGQVYLSMDSLGLALKDINRSILLDADNVWAYRNKGIYFLKTGDTEQAIRLLEEAADRPEFVDELYAYLGEAYLKNGNKAKACESWSTGKGKQEKRSLELFSLHCQ